MPVLAITIPWDPNITEIGGFTLTWHGLFTAIGILAGVRLSLWLAGRVGYDVDNAYSLALVGVPSGIVGARVLYVWENWDRFDGNVGEVFSITEGGISIWGAILGGVLGSLVFALWRKYPIGRGLDIAAFGLILGQAIGRIGDLVNGEHIAKATDLPWGVIYTAPNSPGFAWSIEVGAVHPATTYELLGDLAILAVLFFVLFRVFPRRPGLTFFVYLISYAVMRFFVTYLRVDSAEFGVLAVPQVVSIVVIVASLPGIWYFATRPPLPPGQPLRQPAPEPPAPRSRRERRRASR